MGSFWRRLRERRIVQWTAAYLAGAWLLMQVTHLIGEQFGVPLAVLRSVTAVLVVGALAALVIAWYHGDAGRQKVTAPELLMLAGILILAGSSVAMARREPGLAGVGQQQYAADGSAFARPGISREKSIAVLPFTNLSDDRENEHFSDGLTEELLLDLTRTTNLRVISRTSVMRFKDGELGIRQIGDELGVAYVVAGSVRRHGDRVRINAQLIDARTDQHLWAERYESDWSDIFAIQQQISSRIAGALRAALPADHAAEGSGRSRHTASPEAYQLYLEGRYHFHNRFGPNLAERLNQSAELLRQAVALDPDFGQAWAALALAYASYWGQPGSHTPQGEAAVRAQQASAQAIALDPNIADAYVARGMVHARLLRWGDAEQSFLQALRAEPQNAAAHDWYGILLVTVGRSREAERILRRSAELDPINASTLHWLADALRNSGRLEESRVHAQRSVDLGMFGSAIGIYIYHVQRREWDAAVAYFEAASNARGYNYSFVRPVVGAIGDPRRLPVAVSALRTAAAAEPTLRSFFPAFYFDLPDANLVFDGIEGMISDGLGVYSLWRMWEPQFTELRNHPRMRDVARRTGLLEYWREFGWPDLCRPEGDSFSCR